MEQLEIEKNVMWFYELGEKIGESMRASVRNTIKFFAVYGTSILIGIFAIFVGALLGKKKKNDI